MADPIIIVCDNNGTPTGEYVEREVGHTGEGKHHLAITVLLTNKKGEVLLQKRKHKRFDGLWDLTGATDLYHFEDSTDENFEEATLRCLEREYGIKKVDNLRNLGGFNYFERWGEYCENEFCSMMVGDYTGEVYMDPNVGYMYKWVDKEAFLDHIEHNPEEYTPWAIEGVELLKKVGFFN